jgi:nitrate/nitrite-specific signal transduction histidine kinase
VTAEHLGLKIMRERADSVGAQFEINSQPLIPDVTSSEHGTTIMLLWEASK